MPHVLAAYQSQRSYKVIGYLVLQHLLLMVFNIYLYTFGLFYSLCSQELLEAVERERNVRFNPSRNAAIFHHPTLGDFELQHVRSFLMLVVWVHICDVFMHYVIFLFSCSCQLEQMMLILKSE